MNPQPFFLLQILNEKLFFLLPFLLTVYPFPISTLFLQGTIHAEHSLYFFT